MGPDAALKYIPSVYKLCNVDFLPLYSIDSTNMEPRHWLGMAKAIKDNYESYDGFVILHGTDTMSYTGAALSYLIQNSAKPVVITGSQRPVSMEITDAKHNIYDSFLYACDDESHNISIVFDGHVIAGFFIRSAIIPGIPLLKYSRQILRCNPQTRITHTQYLR